MNRLFLAPWMAAAQLFLLAASSPAEHSAAPLNQTPATLTGEMKAKFEILFAAGLYTRWPDETFERAKEGPNVIKVGVVGDSSSISQELERLAADKQIGGRQVIVRHYPSAAEVELCQILFITSSASRDDRLALLQRYGNSPVLLAGDSPGFLQEGGSLNFQADGGKVRFVLSPQSLARQKLIVDPRFSRLGRAASQPGGPGMLPAGTPVKTMNEHEHPQALKKESPTHPGTRDQFSRPRPHPGGRHP